MSRESYSAIPVKLLALPAELYQLYGAIRSFDWEKAGEARQGCKEEVKTLAQITRKSERQTQRNLCRLVEVGAIHLERRPGNAHRLFCTPERFDPSTSTPDPTHIKEGATPMSGVTSMSSALQDDSIHRNTDVFQADTHAEERDDIHVRGVAHVVTEVTSMSGGRVTSMTPPIDIKTKARNKTSPFPPSEYKAGKIPFAETYPFLLKLKEAAGDKLALGDLVPNKQAPPGFAGILPAPLDQQWHAFLTDWVRSRGLTRSTLEQRLVGFGKYLALGKNYWVKDGKIIALRWLCNKAHRNRVYEILDEAASVGPPVLKNPVHIPLTPKAEPPEKIQAALEMERNRLLDSPTPINEALARILSRVSLIPDTVQARIPQAHE